MGIIKSAETLLLELKKFLRAYNKSLDTGDNSLSKDLLLTPYSIGGKLIMDQVAIARDLAILSRLTGTELDNEGTNYKKERLPGSYSVVTLQFWTEIAPTSDITIPAGTQARTTSTSFTSPVVFETINEVTYSVSEAATYYSYDRARYEFPVTALCTVIGSTGNAGAETIVSLTGSITGITGVTNLLAATGGLDSETDEDMRNRIKLAKLGRDLNVPNGVRGLMQDDGFIDAFAVRVEDAEAEKASGIDVFVIDNPSAAATENFIYSIGQDKYYFANRPILEVTSVKDKLNNPVSASNYSVTVDSTSPMRRSIYAADYIEISPFSGMISGDTFTVSYNYSSAVKQAQETVNLTDNRVLTADILIKRAYPLYLYLTATLTLKALSDGPATRSKCKNALAQYLATYRLGDPVQKSDLIIILQQGYGDYPIDTVDMVRITDYYLQDEFGNSYTPIDEAITVGNKYYVVYGRAVVI